MKRFSSIPVLDNVGYRSVVNGMSISSSIRRAARGDDDGQPEVSCGTCDLTFGIDVFREKDAELLVRPMAYNDDGTARIVKMSAISYNVCEYFDTKENPIAQVVQPGFRVTHFVDGLNPDGHRISLLPADNILISGLLRVSSIHDDEQDSGGCIGVCWKLYSFCIKLRFKGGPAPANVDEGLSQTLLNISSDCIREYSMPFMGSTLLIHYCINEVLETRPGLESILDRYGLKDPYWPFILVGFGMGVGVPECSADDTIGSNFFRQDQSCVVESNIGKCHSIGLNGAVYWCATVMIPRNGNGPATRVLGVDVVGVCQTSCIRIGEMRGFAAWRSDVFGGGGMDLEELHLILSNELATTYSNYDFLVIMDDVYDDVCSDLIPVHVIVHSMPGECSKVIFSTWRHKGPADFTTYHTLNDPVGDLDFCLTFSLDTVIMEPVFITVGDISGTAEVRTSLTNCSHGGIFGAITFFKKFN